MFGQVFFSQRVVNDWNKLLMNDVVSADSVNAFKIGLTKLNSDSIPNINGRGNV